MWVHLPANMHIGPTSVFGSIGIVLLNRIRPTLAFHRQYCIGNTLTAHNWQKWKSTFLTCPCHEICREEGLVGLTNSNYTLKKYVTIFAKWKLVYWPPFWNGKCFSICFCWFMVVLGVYRAYTGLWCKVCAEISPGKYFWGGGPNSAPGRGGGHSHWPVYVMRLSISNGNIKLPYRNIKFFH